MRSISSTMERLAAQRGRQLPPSTPSSERLVALEDFGTNPGALDGWCYVPAGMAPGAALVVALHGCTQNAAGFDRGTGWSHLAEDYGFAVLVPEQTRSNNFNLCFNWYESGDNRRDAGEPLSIRQMIAVMAARYEIDTARVFVTGLSAGGAMASVMLATYPEIFSGGAIIAGLPYGSANTIPEAFDRMRGDHRSSAETLAASVRDASSHRGPWPSVAVWHGTRDTIVDVSNARQIVEQWRLVHGAAVEADDQEIVGRKSRRTWRDSDGLVILEEYLIAGMGHGVPLATSGDAACGVSGAHMLDVGISSTRHIAAAWGLTNEKRRRIRPVSERVEKSVTRDVESIIEGALRAAGLMR